MGRVMQVPTGAYVLGMVNGIPRERLLAAASLTENAHARKTLERMARQGSTRNTPAPAKVAQNASTGAAGTIRVVLPLPPRELHPNSRVHWAVRQKATRAYRHTAYFAAWEEVREVALPPRLDHGRPAGVFGPMWETAEVQLTFYFPDRRRRDADSALASMKAGIDGLAAPVPRGIGAGIIANDSGFSFLPVRMEVDRERPRVEVEVRRTG